MKRQRWYLSLTLLLGATVFSAALFELGIRIIRPYSVPGVPVVSLAPEFEEYKPHGYRLLPSRTFSRKEPKPLTWVSNSDGFRDRREFDEPDDRTRILVVGDSFVFGLGVDQDERFTDVVEDLEPSWRVDNLGMNGYGPDLMLMALEDVGLSARPDVVVFCLYTESFARVHPYFTGYGYELTRYKVRNGELIKTPYPQRRLWDSLHTVWWMRKVKTKLTGSEWKLHAAIVDRLVEMSKESEFTLVLSYLPGYWPDTPGDVQRRSWLRTSAEQHDVAFLDLTGPIYAAGAERAFLPGDIHWNVRGHRIAGEALRDFLANGVLVQSR